MRLTPAELTTLCYIEKEGQYLMLHRIAKTDDINHGKWIGVGGHFEEKETPEECLLREVKEETGLTITKYRFRGIVTFIFDDGIPEYMHLFTATEFTGKETACDEGNLQWISKDKILDLNLWEGDRFFLKKLLCDDLEPFFMKLSYDKDGNLIAPKKD